MRRAISETDQQKVRLLLNSTADQLGISRPLDAVGWYQVKDYLRSQSVNGVPEDWSKEQAALHAMACSNLEMDPPPPRSPIGRAVGTFLCWIGGPADRHRRGSELLRGLVVAGAASLLGALALMAAHYCGITHGIWPFVMGGLLGLMFLQFVISSDTSFGALSLFLLLTGAYSLATGDWALAEWLRITLATGGVVFGALTVSAWLG